jgi:GDP-4-dehydro-6-deoxy-D-mannose reductase
VGALDPERDFLDVRDVCRVYAACLEHSLPAGKILNVASGRQRRIGDVLADLLEAAGVTALVEADPGRLRAADIPVAAGDAGLARECLGWRPVIPWAQTLSDLLQDWSRRLQEEMAV